MAHREMEICSPVASSISISRLEAPGWISRAFSIRSSVVSPWADSTTTTLWPLDVDGVYTADPRNVAGARKIDEITYDEMLELASLGAQVLHNRSVEMAKRYKVGEHPRLPAGEGDDLVAHALDGHGAQGNGDLLAGGQQHIHLPG